MGKLAPSVIEAAQDGDRHYNVPASVSLAQFILESGWGQHMPPGSNNPFGIKARKGRPSVTVRTREVDKRGNSFYVNAAFRKFASLSEAFDAHAALLATAPVYAPAMAAWGHGDLKGGIALMAMHYATDPGYARTLLNLITSLKLTQYDIA